MEDDENQGQGQGQLTLVHKRTAQTQFCQRHGVPYINFCIRCRREEAILKREGVVEEELKKNQMSIPDLVRKLKEHVEGNNFQALGFAFALQGINPSHKVEHTGINGEELAVNILLTAMRSDDGSESLPPPKRSRKDSE